MKIGLYISVLILLVSFGCNKPIEEMKFINDLTKESLNGGVKCVKKYAYKQIEIRYETIKDSSKIQIIGESTLFITIDDYVFNCVDTLYEKLIEEVYFNESGFKIEQISYGIEDRLALWTCEIPREITDVPPAKPYPDRAKDGSKKTYYYDQDGLLCGIDSYGYHHYYCFDFENNIIFDSLFYGNGAIRQVKRWNLTKYGIEKPIWSEPSSGQQFDSNNNLIAEKEIYVYNDGGESFRREGLALYYYSNYDIEGNWLDAKKEIYYNNTSYSVDMRREILYY